MWATIHSLHCCNTLAPFLLLFPSIKCFLRQHAQWKSIITCFHLIDLSHVIILNLQFPVGGEGGMPRRLRTAYTNTQVWKWTISIYILDLYFYTNTQLLELEKEFHFNKYLCRSLIMPQKKGVKEILKKLTICFCTQASADWDRGSSGSDGAASKGKPTLIPLAPDKTLRLTSNSESQRPRAAKRRIVTENLTFAAATQLGNFLPNSPPLLHSPAGPNSSCIPHPPDNQVPIHPQPDFRWKLIAVDGASPLPWSIENWVIREHIVSAVAIHPGTKGGLTRVVGISAR